MNGWTVPWWPPVRGAVMEPSSSSSSARALPLPRCHELGFSASHHPKEGANAQKKRAQCILHIKARDPSGWYMRLRGVF